MVLGLPRLIKGEDGVVWGKEEGTGQHSCVGGFVCATVYGY
jgi:hypothetical protein